MCQCCGQLEGLVWDINLEADTITLKCAACLTAVKKRQDRRRAKRLRSLIHSRSGMPSSKGAHLGGVGRGR